VGKITSALLGNFTSALTIYIVLRESFGGTTEERPVTRARGRPELGTTPRPARRGTAPSQQSGLAKPAAKS
jgi:hypothetical protein